MFTFCMLLWCLVKSLIDIGGKEWVFVTTTTGNTTALQYARLSSESDHVIKMLVDVGGEDIFMAKDNYGDTVLHFLCIHTSYTSRQPIISNYFFKLAMHIYSCPQRTMMGIRCFKS